MKIKGLYLFSVVLVFLMVIFAFYLNGLVPEGTELPIHWNAAGEADDFAPALVALLLPAGLLAGVATLFAVIPQIEPLQNRLEGSAPVLRASWVGMILIAVAIQMAVALPVLGYDIGPMLPLIGAGLLFIMLGNALPKSRPGFFVGIRTPWAIIDTDNWIATHRLGGKLFILAGIAILCAALLPLSPEVKTYMVIGMALAAAILPFIYSWWLWQRKGGGPSSGASTAGEG